MSFFEVYFIDYAIIVVPQTLYLKQHKFIQVLKVGSPNWVLRVSNQGVGRAAFLQEALREFNNFLASFTF